MGQGKILENSSSLRKVAKKEKAKNFQG